MSVRISAWFELRKRLKFRVQYLLRSLTQAVIDSVTTKSNTWASNEKKTNTIGNSSRYKQSVPVDYRIKSVQRYWLDETNRLIANIGPKTLERVQ